MPVDCRLDSLVVSLFRRKVEIASFFPSWSKPSTLWNKLNVLSLLERVNLGGSGDMDSMSSWYTLRDGEGSFVELLKVSRESSSVVFRGSCRSRYSKYQKKKYWGSCKGGEDTEGSRGVVDSDTGLTLSEGNV